MLDRLFEIDRELNSLIDEKISIIKNMAKEFNKKVIPKLKKKFNIEAFADYYVDYEDSTYALVYIRVLSQYEFNYTYISEILKNEEELKENIREFIKREFAEFAKIVDKYVVVSFEFLESYFAFLSKAKEKGLL
ncbi:MAG: hypothetical protein Q9M37_03530 [Desulfonauticus sp.]|nr:hypothetical protein [Desulfonauticus sp.]